MPNGKVRNTYKSMVDKIKKRESLGWATKPIPERMERI
jgi:hypothetical protein